MARIEISSVSNPYGTGELQLQNKVAMSGTLTAVTDNLNTASSLQLSTSSANFTGTLTSAGTINGFNLTGSSGDRRILTNSNYFFLQDNSGTVFQMQGGKFSTSQFDGTAKFNIRGTGSTSATSSLIVQNSGGTETMRVNDNGSVRVLSTLNVSGDGGTGGSLTYGFIVYDNGNGYSKSLFHCQNAQTYVFANPQAVAMDGFEKFSGGLRINGGVDLSFMTEANLRMKILSSNGNVGIGTDSPTQKLLVVGNVQGTNLISTSNVACGNVLYNNNFYCESSGNTNIGGGQAPATARLQVKGSGSTSATTSLLVQNSGGSELFKVRDDGYVNVSATNGMNIGGLYLSGLSYNGTINFGNNDLSIGCDVNGRRVNLYSGNTNVLTIFKSATNYGVGISDSGSDYPVPSAVLQANSTTRGFLPPRMTDAQVRAIVSPAVGLMAYNTDLDCPVFYSSAGWRRISHSVM